MANNILEKLDGLEARFEEVGTLITDPAVIADQQRYVKLTKEYKDLEDIMKAKKKYVACLDAIKEAKDVLANEKDPDMKELARDIAAWKKDGKTVYGYSNNQNGIVKFRGFYGDYRITVTQDGKQYESNVRLLSDMSNIHTVKMK